MKDVYIYLSVLHLTIAPRSFHLFQSHGNFFVPPARPRLYIASIVHPSEYASTNQNVSHACKTATIILYIFSLWFPLGLLRITGCVFTSGRASQLPNSGLADFQPAHGLKIFIKRLKLVQLFMEASRGRVRCA